MTSTASRLERARNRMRIPSLRRFHQYLVEGPPDGNDPWPESDRLSYEAVRTYHQDREPREPPVAYLVRVARVFGIRLEWLATGQGRMLESEEEAEDEWRRRSLQEAPERREGRIAPALEILDDPQAEAALRRFNQKLYDSYFPGCPWEAEEEHTELLRLAGRFLVGVTEVVVGLRPEDAAGALQAGRLLLLGGASPSWRSQWYDALLVLFASRVKGLGERTGDWHDARSPVSRHGDSPAEPLPEGAEIPPAEED